MCGPDTTHTRALFSFFRPAERTTGGLPHTRALSLSQTRGASRARQPAHASRAPPRAPRRPRRDRRHFAGRPSANGAPRAPRPRVSLCGGERASCRDDAAQRACITRGGGAAAGTTRRRFRKPGVDPKSTCAHAPSLPCLPLQDYPLAPLEDDCKVRERAERRGERRADDASFRRKIARPPFALSHPPQLLGSLLDECLRIEVGDDLFSKVGRFVFLCWPTGRGGEGRGPPAGPACARKGGRATTAAAAVDPPPSVLTTLLSLSLSFHTRSNASAPPPSARPPWRAPATTTPRTRSRSA